MTTLRFSARVWRWQGDAAWYFVTLPEAEAGEVRLHALGEGLARPGGMVKVHVALGELSWSTSLFASRESGYLLPLKADIRRRARLANGDEVLITLTLLS